MRLQLNDYKEGILAGDRIVLARAITLIESALPEDQQLAGEVLDTVMAHTGNSLRMGITGAPGVGKSTFIESFGQTLIRAGKKVAVLTIDPTSQITGGSILGDKTRMQELANERGAFIRPSPSGQTLGGVASHTRESILLCEAAGFDYIIVETVGTGQSEYAVKHMVDFFLLLIQPGSGDELQGIKKGIVEMADAIAVTKADGDNTKAAKATRVDFQHALHTIEAMKAKGASVSDDMIRQKIFASKAVAEADRKEAHVREMRDKIAKIKAAIQAATLQKAALGGNVK